MRARITEVQYSQLLEFMHKVSVRDVKGLSDKFSLSSAVIDEIFESVKFYFGEGAVLSVPVMPSVNMPCNNCEAIVAYSLGGEDIAVDFNVLEDGQLSEVTIHVEFASEEEGVLFYKYIDS